MINNEIKVSVRELVEHVLRTGNLSTGVVSSNRAVQGTKAHQTVQKSLKAGFGDHIEFLVEHQILYTINYNDFDIKIEGRIDGLVKDDNDITVIEIKSTYSDLDKLLFDDKHPHWAQAVCYAYIYAEQNGIDNLTIQLLYYHLESEEFRSFMEKYDFNKLKEYFFDIVGRYLELFVLSRDWIRKRDKSIKNLAFPYNNYRKGQRDFVVAAYKTIRESKRLFIQAPTGTGKTISVLFPAIKAICEENVKKIFYLTARTTHSQAAETAINIMSQKGLNLRCITITAKEKVCTKEETNCDSEYCDLARGYYDRIDSAIKDILASENILNSEIINYYALKHKVCPFEYALEISLWVDCIICDYNYVFDPKVYLKRFFGERSKTDYVILVDEAHNLVDRAREMYSADLCKSEIMALKKGLRVFHKKDGIVKSLNQINSYLIGVKKKCADNNYSVQNDAPKDIYPLLKEFINEAEQWMPQNVGSVNFDKVLDLYFRMDMFLKIGELYDSRFVTYAITTRIDTSIRLYCIDPSYLLQEVMKKLKSGIFFSATLSPINYYREMLGGYNDDYTMALNSPFDNKKLGVFISDNISTKYNHRADTYYAVVDIIKSAISTRKGNYIVFFPSYKYMNEVYDRFRERYPDINSEIQNTAMGEQARIEFLNKFEADNDEVFAAFAVLGGIFSEGIDLVGNRLSGAIIIGVGLPQICVERDIISAYFQDKNNLGFEYSYVYPGINKVLQAAGRVIRTEDDTGILVLIDERYKNGMYKRLLPKEWSGNTTIKDTKQLEKGISCFWSKML